MIWIVLHWVFLFICEPHWLFHGITSILLTIYQLYFRKKRIEWKKNIYDVLGVTLMYVGFYICEQLYHFSFLPFWGVTLVGLRKKTTAVIFLGVVTGFILNFLVLQQVLGHVCMNAGRLLRIKSINVNTTIISHTIIGIICLIVKRDIVRFTQREVLAVISTIHMIDKYERMDLFSLCMCFTHFVALLASLLHFVVPYWYNYYENNHFYMVKNQYLFLVPIGILVQRVWYSIL